ncbi:MAG: cytidylate kinase family protein [Thermodesulfobacteriota bacterium]
MAIITVSHGGASGGVKLAEDLSKRLGYKLVSREDIVREAARFGVPEDMLKQALVRSLSFWDRLRHERRRYLAFVQAALCEHAASDNIVYYGNAGHLLLAGVSHVLCIRLIAPLALRIKIAGERLNLSQDDAVPFIEQMDRERQNWTRFLYGVDWLDPGLYDLTINLKTMDVAGAVEVAAAAAARPEFAPTDASRAAMSDLLLASRVRAALASDGRTASVDIAVRAGAGVVHLKGKLRSASLVSAVMEVAEKVPGVTGLDREELDALEVMV